MTGINHIFFLWLDLRCHLGFPYGLFIAVSCGSKRYLEVDINEESFNIAEEKAQKITSKTQGPGDHEEADVDYLALKSGQHFEPFLLYRLECLLTKYFSLSEYLTWINLS